MPYGYVQAILNHNLVRVSLSTIADAYISSSSWSTYSTPSMKPTISSAKTETSIVIFLSVMMLTIGVCSPGLEDCNYLLPRLNRRHVLIPHRTITHHPDKITDPQSRPYAEALYVHLKLCRDVLVDPAKRFAYDRFGPEILNWRHCTTIQDYVKTGLQNTFMYYSGTGAVLVVLGLVGYLKQAAFVSPNDIDSATCQF